MVSRVDAQQVGSPFDGKWDIRGHAYFEHLRRRLRWQLLVAYVTPLIMLSLYFHYQYNATLRQGIVSHLKSVAENQRNTVDLFLQERVANVRSAFREEAFSHPPTSMFMERMLMGLREESSTFVDIGLFDPQANLVSYSGPYPTLVGKSYQNEPWWRSLHGQKRDFFISDVFLGFRARPHFIIAIRRTIEDQDWILRASVDPMRFAEFVGSSHLIAEAEAFLVNGQGLPQTPSEAGSLGQGSTMVPERSADTKVVEVTENQNEYLSAFAWLKTNDWALVVRVPVDLAYAPLRKARVILVGIMLLTLVIIVFLVIRNTRALVSRLEATDTAKEDLRRQLFNAAKLASVGEMAAGVAHEINNPLAIIYEEAGIMKDLLDPTYGQRVNLDDFRERLEAIGEAAIRGRSITRKLLGFARKHEPCLQETNINDLLERVLRVKDTEFRVSNIEVTRDLSEGLPLLSIDSNLMEQVLLNLLNNAKDAMSEGGVIMARTRLSQRHVEIEVEDSGCGMTEAQMEQIFFPFYTTKGVGKGTGLGLSISYGIIKTMGGRIEVKSEPGAGTTFTIMLPVAKKEKREHVLEGELQQ